MLKTRKKVKEKTLPQSNTMTYTTQRLLSLTLPRANFIKTHDFYGKHSVLVFICGNYVLTYCFGFKVLC